MSMQLLGETFDIHECDVNRFENYQIAPAYVLERDCQNFREVYDILHPLQQMSHPRELRLTPFYARHRELGGQFFSGAGWERPQWFEANHVLTGAPWWKVWAFRERPVGRED
jgi:dimethylglycine oxidase